MHVPMVGARGARVGRPRTLCIMMARADMAGAAIFWWNQGQIHPFSGMCTTETRSPLSLTARHRLYEMPASS